MRTNRTLTLIPMMTAVTAICSMIAIPSPFGVPFTLQTFGIILTGLILGWKKGSAAVLVYLALGAAGLPVFSGFTGGIGSFAGVTGGFLIGFVPLAALCGASFGKSRSSGYLKAAAGLAVCHLMGCVWMTFILGISFRQAVLTGSFPFIIKDILSAAGAFAVYEALKNTGIMHKY